MATQGDKWKGFHMILKTQEDVGYLTRAINEYLAELGINVLVLEVNTNFQFQSHPELSEGTVTHRDARELSQLCKEKGIRLIPLFNCLGHQGWGGKPNSILRVYSEFDETPSIPVEAKWPDIYCRSWCPLHPGINPIVFDLIDELIEAFAADMFHVGMDEVFEMASDECPRCRGKNRADLFAKAVNDYYEHLSAKNVQMLMWADRLIDGKGLGYSIWEGDHLGTWPAVDKIPTDIILCDWHYGKQAHYLSVYYFLNRGFPVWPATWNQVDAALAFKCYSERAAKELDADDRMLGMLVTGWGVTGETLLKGLSGIIDDNGGDYEAAKRSAEVVDTLRAVMRSYPTGE
ncbi:MAG: family 20 glycosylhydrolase [Firmicutes bacterium]|nr:family 20 glycosylhydrolase [Bacillota bacterium]